MDNAVGSVGAQGALNVRDLELLEANVARTIKSAQNPSVPDLSHLGVAATGGGSAKPQLETPKLDGSSLALQLLELQSKLTDNQLTSSKNDIEIRRAQNQQKFQEQMKALQDFAAKNAEAQKSGQIGKIFSWIAMGLAAIAMVAATVATVLTGGATAPVVAGLVIGMVALAATATYTGLQDSGKLADLLKGLDDKQKMGVTIGIQAALLVMTIISAALSFGAGAGAAAEAVSSTVKTATSVAQVVKSSAQVAESAATIGQGAATISSAVLQYDASNAQADAMSIKAKLQKSQSLIEDEMDRIRKMMQEMDDSASRIFSAIQGGNATTMQIAKNMV
ncbi:MAG: type III secretion system translocon subunit SctE [Candidatus Competibacteraceae bacterium]|nr:type III secretion system translocon subunit SctE [Candidatus Competibacteraceae bacterium]